MEEDQNILEEQKWLYELYVHAPIAIAIYIGKQHVIEFANPLMCEIWDRSVEDVKGKPLFKALPEVQEQGFEEILARVLELGKPFVGNEMPATLERKGKTRLYYFNILYKPLKNNKKETIGIIQIAHDVTDLVEARKKAESNEEVLKEALAAAKMGTWHYDLIQKKTSKSKEHDSVYGYKEGIKDWNFEFFINQVVKEEREAARKKIEEGLTQGALDLEARILWPDKSIHWVNLKGKTTFNLKGRPISVVGVIADITDKKISIEKERQLAIEQAARKEAERSSKVLENLFMDAPALICTLRGPDHIFDLANPLYQQLFSGRELKGKSVLEALPEIEGQPFKGMLDGVYQTGKTFIGNEIPLQFDRNNKGKLETGYFNFVYQANRNAEGEIIGVLVFAFEVTDQIFARKNVERNQENLNLALEAGKMGAWQMDFVRNWSLHSEQFDKIFGYNKNHQRWGYKLFMKHVLESFRPEVAANFRKARETGELNFETQIIGKDGKTKWIALKGRMFFENDAPVAMAGIVQDISEQQEAEERLKRLTEDLAASNEELRAANEEIQSHADEMAETNYQLKIINADLDNFIYAASHDLKAPIANIEGLIGLLLRNLSSATLENDLVKKIISSIEASVARFKKTIGELTDVAKLQRQVEETSLIDLSEIINEVLLDLETSIKEAQVIVELDIENCPSIVFSYNNIKSILFNLISNAIKYRSPDRAPTVSVSCKAIANHLIITIKDNGLGIKGKNIDKIFSMFTRLHTHVEGTGVGLYLVKRIVDNVGGKLEVESEEGQGSTFKVLLPLESNR